MKKTSYIHSLLAFLFLSGGLAACTVDVEEISGEQGQPVTIAIETETRSPGNNPDVTGIHYGDGIDSKIEKVRVLGFRVSNGTLAFNELVDVNALESDPVNGSVKGTIDVLTGRYDFVFIANEGSDLTLAAKLADNTQVASFGLLKNLSFAQSAFSETASIPMVRMVENVLVIGDNTLQSSEGNVDNGVWNVAMKRLGVRVELELDMSDAFATSGVLSFANVPDEVFLLQKENIAATSTRTISLTPTVTSVAGGKKLTWSRIILPESWFTDKTEKDNAVEIRMTHSGDVKKAYLGIDPGTDYTMPRNHYFKITGTVKDSGINFSLHVLNWNDVANNVNIPKPYTIVINPNVIEYQWNIAQTGTTAQLTTDYSGSWTAEIVDPADNTWLRFIGNQTSVSGTGNQTLSFILGNDTPVAGELMDGGAQRQIGRVKVTAGRISTVVTVAIRKPKP